MVLVYAFPVKGRFKVKAVGRELLKFSALRNELWSARCLAGSRKMERRMKPLTAAGDAEFAGIRFVLTDMDETLTYHGLLHAATYAALERLRDAGLVVIPVTAAPAGWCDQMARMWPVDGVIGENGGFFFQRKSGESGLHRDFWHEGPDLGALERRLEEIARRVLEAAPHAKLAEDHRFRLTSVAFAKPDDPALCAQILSALREAGADATVNNIWVLGWLGGYDKLAMARRVLRRVYDLDIETDGDRVIYTGDSTNDAPMFAHFKHSVGVSTVRDFLSEIPTPPAWITQGPGGAGFVEAAEAVIRSRS
jgi:HAD superfamily hydrolase (TIGR01484 family)